MLEDRDILAELSTGPKFILELQWILKSHNTSVISLEQLLLDLRRRGMVDLRDR